MTPEAHEVIRQFIDAAEEPEGSVATLQPSTVIGATMAALPTGRQPTDFPLLLAAAQTLNGDDVDGVTLLVAQAALLDPIKRDTVIKAIHAATAIPMATLRDQLKVTSKREEIDHLQLARAVIVQVGLENILLVDEALWVWDSSGVWVQDGDRPLKLAIQTLAATNNLPVTAAFVNGTLDVLKSEVHARNHVFNRGDQETVNCLNGQVVLQDGRWALTPHRREDYRTTQLPITFDRDALAPRFLAFLDEVFRDDPDREDKIRAVLELIGYTLMSHTRHEKFVILIGAGANGKSVLLKVIAGLCGFQNVAAVQPAQFNNTFQRAHLDHKLANIVTELKQGEVIADAELKGITSGEPTTVEHKFRNPFVMQPYCTCWFGTNHMPHTRDFSEALFRRALIIPFNRVFSADEQDPRLWDTLKTELPGILNLALDAYCDAVGLGFTEPATSATAKQEWRLEADQVAQFVDDICVRHAGRDETIGGLYQAYDDWADNMGISKKVGQKEFRQRLNRLGFGERRTSEARWATGIGLRPRS